jgi:quinolinate synthase
VRTEADVIVLAGVHFMAETARLLNPDKVVLILELGAGCSLAASITAADIRLLRECYPGVPIVTYVNASAAVEAEADICCTSANAKKIIEALGVPRVIMLADEYLAGSTAAQTSVEIIAWKSIARCMSGSLRPDIRSLRKSRPGITELAH